MASVFSSYDGSVVMVRLPSVPEPLFKINVDGNPFVAPITGFALDMQGNYQFLHTVNEFIYLYVFGDRISDLVLTGMCFTDPCGATPGRVDAVFNFYKANRVAALDRPLNIQLGSMGNFVAFLTGAKIEQPKADNGVVQWIMRFNTLMPT